MVGFSDCFRDDPQSANDRHEVGITQPARDDMGMDMVGLTGAGDAAHIDTNIEAGGLESFLQDLDAHRGDVHVLVKFAFR